MSSDYRLFNRSPWDFEPLPGANFQAREFPPPQRAVQDDPFAPPIPIPRRPYKPVPPPSGLEGYSRGFMGLVGRSKAAKRQAAIEENEAIERDWKQENETLRQRYHDRIEAEKFRIYRETAGRKDYEDQVLAGEDGPELWFVNKNDPNDRMKIGRAYEKPSPPDRSMDDREFFANDPKRWKEYHGGLARIAADGREGRAPSSMELLYSYSNSPDPSKRAFAERLMSQKDPALRVRANAAIQMAREAAMEVDPLRSWKPIFNVEKFQRELERLLEEGGWEPSGRAEAPPSQPAASERRGRRVRVKTRDGRVLSGTIDAEGNFIPEPAGHR